MLRVRSKPPNHSRLPSLSSRLVAVETDGFGVRAAVIRRKGKSELVIERLARSGNADPFEATLEALAELRRAGSRLPRRAIVVSVEVTPALLSLPRTMEKRPAQQLQTALRWEIEPRVAQRTGSRQIGGIFVGQGAIPADEVEQMLAIQEQRRQTEHTGQRPPRLGELARELGYVTPGQVDEALELQKWFTKEDVDLACGWTALGDRGSGAASAESRAPWLVAGLCRERRRRWIETLRLAGIELEGIYPLAGAAAPLIADRCEVPSGCIQVERGLVVHSRLHRGRPEALELRYMGEKAPSVKESHAFLTSERLESVWVCGRDIDTFAAGLSALNGCEVGRLPAPGLSLPAGKPAEKPKDTAPADSSAHTADEITTSEALAPLFGAARHALGLAPVESAVCVPARDPAEPLTRQPLFLGLLLLAAFVVLGSLADLWIRDWRDTVIDEAHTLEMRLAGHREEHRAAASRTRVHEAMLTDKAAEEERLRAARSRLGYVETVLPQRARFLPAFLESLSGAVDQDVYIESVVETAPYQIELSGLALSDGAAQRFLRSLAGTLAPLELMFLEQSASTRRAGELAGAVTITALIGRAPGLEGGAER